MDVFYIFHKITTMKRLLLSLTVFGLCLMVTGQEPEALSYKTIVRNVAGEPVISKIV